MAEAVPIHRPQRHLPAAGVTMADLAAMRSNPMALSNNDRVEVFFQKLMTSSSAFCALIDGVCNAETVEGTIPNDDHEAARMIRDLAKAERDGFIEHKNIATIIKALHVVMRRYNLDRKRRANILGGEEVPNGDDE